MISFDNYNRITIDGRYLYCNGEKYLLPKSCRGNNLTTINGKIFIDGFEFYHGKFKRTFRALFHKYF